MLPQATYYLDTYLRPVDFYQFLTYKLRFSTEYLYAY